MTARRSRTEGSRRGAIAAIAAALVGLVITAAAGSATHSPVAPRIPLSVQASPSTGFGSKTTKADDLCGQAAGLVCTQVVVPLDRTGVVPGSISLHVEELPATGVARGTIFLIAGGPGQGSAHVFALGDPTADSLYRYLFPGYNLVAYDDRGTGESGLITCPALQTAITEAANRTAAAACGTSLGSAANFYSTAQHAEDLDAVRASLGVNTIALYGVSYGTKLALAYALAHPDHVERLLLDSVLPTDLPDPYESNVLREMPSKLQTYCAVGCNGPRLAADVVALANKYAAQPLKGKVLTASGRQVPETVVGDDIFSIVLDADLSPGEAAELAAVMHAARTGNTQPLLRLAMLHAQGNEESAIDLSAGLYAATVCRDGTFPWDPNLPAAQRPAALQAAIAALPAGSFGQFGAWAGNFGNADFCLQWPGTEGGATLGVGPLPNVPMLAVSGGFDMRTPTTGAQSVVAQFPQGHLLVVPGVGHSTVTADPSGCAVNAVRSWMLDQTVPTSCPLTKPLVAPVSALPLPGQAKPRTTQSAKVTYAAVKQTLQDAQALWLMTAGVGSAASVPGLYGGSMRGTAQLFTLSNFSDERGVTVSGKLTLSKFGPPLVFQGSVTVGGAAAAHGILGLQGASLRGTLGGRTVG